jgi:predicted dinucleotide-binding enzyme
MKPREVHFAELRVVQFWSAANDPKRTYDALPLNIGDEAVKITKYVFTAVILLACSVSLAAQEQATIAIIGTGDMGDSLGPQFAKMGYQVIYGSRDPESDKAKTLAEITGNNARVVSQKDAAAASEIVVLAIRWPAMESVAKDLDLDGKVVIDISVAWQQGADGYPENTIQPSAAELIQRWNPKAKVVKTFATAGSTVIDEPASAGGMVTMPVASDYRDAKELAANLVADMGFDPVDFGPLRMAHIIEEMQVMWLIPVVQRQSAGWEIHFRRSNPPCHWGPTEDWAEPVADAGNLARIPQSQETPKPCP